jgi:hypothetical protein
VGKTSSSLSSAGVEAKSDGTLFATRDSNQPVLFSRLSNDGPIVGFYKDLAFVGAIGVDSGDNLYITGQSGDTGGIYMNATSVYPAYQGSGRDNYYNLGEASIRWKDLYLSGGVYLGGTGSANKLDDYEEGTWTPTLNDYGGTPTFANATYTKVGNLVLVTVQVGLDGTSDASIFQVASLPFTCMNTTNSVFGGAVSYTNSTFTSNIYVLVTANNTRFTLYQPNGNTVSYNDIGTNKTIRLFVSYRTT